MKQEIAPWDVLGDRIAAHRAAAAVGGRNEAAALGFLPWVESLAAQGGLKIDGVDFDLRSRPVLREIYAAMPATIEEARRSTVVLMKAAQMGASVLSFLYALWMGIAWEPVVVGLFLPDQATALDISQRRFLRVIRAVPDLHRRLTTRVMPDGSVLNVGEQNVLTRILGESHFLFGWTSSDTVTESRAMDAEIVDEVQQISLEALDRIYERMSASRIRFRFMLSTANAPEADIAFWWNEGTRKSWFSRCEACGAESDLSQHFPSCVTLNTGQIAGAPLDYVYVCPACSAWLPDPANPGRFVAGCPEAHIDSYHISQIVSNTITARDMIEAWNRAVTGDQRKTFWNRKLGIPYIDPEQVPLDMAACMASAEEGERLGLTWQTSNSSDDVYMGVDQHAAWCAVIIKRRLPDNRQAVIHAEAIFSVDANPFARCDELMRQYNVSIAVVEQLPNANDARRFCARWAGRAYMVSAYTGAGSDMITWGDASSRSDRKTAVDDRSRYTVGVQQYRMMQNSLMRIKTRHCLYPSAILEQTVLDRGEWKRANLVRDWIFRDYCATGLVVEMDDVERKPKPKVVKLKGIDPHFSFATMLCDVGWTRVHGGSMTLLPERPVIGHRPDPETPLGQRIDKVMPGLPKPVLDMMDEGVRESTCGHCQEFDKERSYCKLRFFNTRAEEVSCDLFERLR